MTEGDLQAAAGIDSKTLKALEAGTRSPQEKTQLKIEAVLLWKPGSIEALYEGQEPTELADEEAEPPTVTASDLTDDELLAEVRRRMRGERNVLEANASAGASSKASKEKEDLAALSPPEIDDVTVTKSITPDLGEHSEDTGGLGGSPGGGGDVDDEGSDTAS